MLLRKLRDLEIYVCVVLTKRFLLFRKYNATSVRVLAIFAVQNTLIVVRENFPVTDVVY